jgi:mono/diheme cytochrome c family protein
MARAVRQITNGGGGMPAFKGKLTEKQIRALAGYVVKNAGRG